MASCCCCPPLTARRPCGRASSSATGSSRRRTPGSSRRARVGLQADLQVLQHRQLREDLAALRDVADARPAPAPPAGPASGRGRRSGRRPCDRRSRPMTLLSSVVLPTPLRPIRQTTCPAGTSRSTSRRTATRRSEHRDSGPRTSASPRQRSGADEPDAAREACGPPGCRSAPRRAADSDASRGGRRDRRGPCRARGRPRSPSGRAAPRPTRALAQHPALVQHGHLLGDLADESHVVVDDQQRVLAAPSPSAARRSAPTRAASCRRPARPPAAARGPGPSACPAPATASRRAPACRPAGWPRRARPIVSRISPTRSRPSLAERGRQRREHAARYLAAPAAGSPAPSGS